MIVSKSRCMLVQGSLWPVAGIADMQCVSKCRSLSYSGAHAWLPYRAAKLLCRDVIGSGILLAAACSIGTLSQV